MNKKIIFIVLIISLIAAVYYGWNYFRDNQNGNKISASGTIEAVEIKIGSKVAGRIQKIFFDEGAFVKKSETVARIDAPEILSQLKSAKAAQSIAKSRFQNAKNDFVRAKELYKNSLISSQQFDLQRHQADSSSDNLIQANSQLEVAESQHDDTFIKSPINGIILVKSVEEGELISPGGVVFTVADLKTLELKLYVTEIELGRINLGDAAEINVDSYPREKFPGKVIYISSKAEFTPKNIQTKEERVNQMFEVKIKLPNPDLRLKPGLPADAEIKIKS